MSVQKKYGSYCFLCGNLPENIGTKKVSLHATNEKRFLMWEKVIKKVGFQIGSRLCDRHFDVSDIIKGREIGGTFFKYARWNLTDTAVPKYFLGTDLTYVTLKGCNPKVKAASKKQNPSAESFSKNSSHRSSKNDANQLTNVVHKHAKNQEPSLNTMVIEIDAQPSIQDNHHQTEDDDPLVHEVVEMDDQHSVSDKLLHQDSTTGDGHLATDREPLVHMTVSKPSLLRTSDIPPSPSPCKVDSFICELNFESLTRVVNIPDNWRWNIILKTCDTTSISGKTVVHKMVVITSELLTFFVNGREVFFPFLKTKTWTPFDLQRAVDEFDSQNLCAGLLDPSLYNQVIAKKNIYCIGTLHSYKCKSFCDKDEKQCTNCRIHEGKLKHFKMAQSQKLATVQKRLKTSQRKVYRYIEHRKDAALMVNDLRSTINAFSASNKLSKKKIKHQT